MKRLRRWLLVLIGILVLVITLAFIFISPIAKYFIEKYDVQYTGREIKMNKIFLNLFTGTASITDFVIYEKDGKTAFFKAGKLKATISLYKLWRDKYDLSNIEAESPTITIIQKGNHFNYDDIVTKMSGEPDTADSTTTTNSKATQYWIRNLSIKDFTITYINTLPYNKVSIQKGSLIIPLIAWNDPVYKVDCGFSFAEGGTIQSKTIYNNKSGLFTLGLDVKQFNCSILFPYLKDYMQATSLDGLFSTTLNISGNANKPEEVAAAGLLSLEKFSVVDNIREKLLACDKLEIKVDSVNTKQNLYDFKTVDLDRPFIKFAMYDDGFNYERLLKSSPAASAGSSNDPSSSYANVFVMASEYLNDIIKDYVISNYNADALKIKNGTLVFSDYTLEDKFQYQFDSLNILSDRISSNNHRIAFELSSILNSTGNLKGSMYISPDNFKDVELELNVSKLMVSDFNPYSVYYVATPFLDGNVFYTNKTTIHNRKLDNKNELTIYKMKAGKKVKNKTAIKVPVRLAVSLLKDVKGDIHLKIPVSGSLDDPKFKWGKIVWQVLKNLMLKAATAPYRLLAGRFGGNESDYKEIVFQYDQPALNEKQLKQLEQLVSILQKDEEVKLELVSMMNTEDESEHIATQLAKRRFLKINDSISISKEQSTLLSELSLKDSSFIKFLDEQTGAQRLQSVQDKCIQFIGKEKINGLVAQQSQLRKKFITDYFSQKQITQDRLLFTLPKGAATASRSEPPKFLVNVAAIGEEDDDDSKK